MVSSNACQRRCPLLTRTFCSDNTRVLFSEDICITHTCREREGSAVSGRANHKETKTFLTPRPTRYTASKLSPALNPSMRTIISRNYVLLYSSYRTDSHLLAWEYMSLKLRSIILMACGGYASKRRAYKQERRALRHGLDDCMQPHRHKLATHAQGPVKSRKLSTTEGGPSRFRFKCTCNKTGRDRSNTRIDCTDYVPAEDTMQRKGSWIVLS